METSKMICMGCDNDAFEEEDGFFYCLQCGVRADDIIATAVDEEDLAGEGGGTRGATYSQLNTRRQTTKPSQPEETNSYSQFRSQLKSASKIHQSASFHGDLGPTEPEDFGAEAVALSYEDCYQQTRDRYVNGLVMMITYQCDALVEKFSVTPLIIGLVAPICLRFLALSGTFDDDWADKAIRDSELQSQEKDLPLGEEDEDGEVFLLRLQPIKAERKREIELEAKSDFEVMRAKKDKRLRNSKFQILRNALLVTDTGPLSLLIL